MKRFAAVFILTAVIVGALCCSLPRKFETVASRFDGTACVYCRSTSLPSVDMGNGRLVRCDCATLGDVLEMCNGVDGVSVSFCGSSEDAERIAARLAVAEVSRQELDGLTVVCGYSAKIVGYVWLGGARVNVQIAFNRGVVTVGSPLILGDY